MSLLVWLPLNGDLTNYGLSPAKFTAVNNSNALSSASGGKIGANMYQRTKINTADYITSDINFNLNGDFSMACWCKVTQVANTSTANGIITNHGHNTGGAGITLKVVNATTCYMSCNTGTNGSNRTYMTYYGTTNIFGDWHHLCLTYDRSVTKYRLYVDGVCEKEFIFGDTAGDRPFHLFDWSIDYSTNTAYRPACQLNDVRLYDNCLTKKEVQEIAKGLILHMPLDNNGMGGENILTNSFGTITSTDYNCATYIPEIPLIDGETYTITACFTAPAGVTGYGIYVSGGYKSFGTLSTSGAGTYTISKTFTAGYYAGRTPADAISNSYIRMYRFPNDGTVTASTTFHWAKVEKGSKATAWSPNPIDNGGSPLHIYETSGYNHQGTAVQRMSVLPDTPRYNVCTKWVNGTDFIHIPNFFVKDQLIDEISIAGWFKTNTLNNTYPNMFNFGANDFIRGRIASNTSLWSYWNINNTRVGITAGAEKTLTDNVWHHYAFTFNKGIIKTYIDGVLKNTSNQTATGTQLKVGSISNWGLGGYSPTAEKFLGEQSDFRTYCTVLSDLEILELYEGRPAIDNAGNFYVHALEENELNPVGIKDTCVAMAPLDFYEDNITNIAYDTVPYDYTGVIYSKTPAKDGVNETLYPGFKIHYGGKHMHNKRAKISMTVQWGGFDTSSTAGTFSIYFQGSAILQNGSTTWTSPTGVYNAPCSALNNSKNLKNLVLGATSGTYNYETEFTINCGTGDDFVAGHVVSMRADYSNGTGWIKFSNIKVTPMDTFSSEEQPFKISEDNITSKYIYEY